MERTIKNINGVDLAYKEYGEGVSVVFLHGFMESSDIWDSFAEELSVSNRVITPDLPGFGASGMAGAIHRMDEVASLIIKLLKQIEAFPAVIIGHSMGGYIALEIAEQCSEGVLALTLFHSNANEDSSEARTNRNRTIELVKQDKGNFINSFITALFAPTNRGRLEKEIKVLKKRASAIPPESIIASLEGMKIRRNHYNTLRNLNVPVLFIIGQNDSRIDMEKIKEQIMLPELSVVLLLRTCGHMGYLENPDECLKAIKAIVG